MTKPSKVESADPSRADPTSADHSPAIASQTDIKPIKLPDSHHVVSPAAAAAVDVNDSLSGESGSDKSSAEAENSCSTDESSCTTAKVTAQQQPVNAGNVKLEAKPAVSVKTECLHLKPLSADVSKLSADSRQATDVSKQEADVGKQSADIQQTDANRNPQVSELPATPVRVEKAESLTSEGCHLAPSAVSVVSCQSLLSSSAVKSGGLPSPRPTKSLPEKQSFQASC